MGRVRGGKWGEGSFISVDLGVRLGWGVKSGGACGVGRVRGGVGTVHPIGDSCS